MFQQLKGDGIISTRGLKRMPFSTAGWYFDVNTACFHNHGGYDFQTVLTPTHTNPPIENR